MLNAAWRAALLTVVVCAFLISTRSRSDDLAFACRRTSRWSRWAVRILGLRSSLRGRIPSRSGPDGPPSPSRLRLLPRGRLIVANHCSWVDPLLFAARRPAVFVTSLEVERDALLGRICAAAGCLFIDRRHVGTLRTSCDHISRILATHDVVVFPEATSSDGQVVLPFRPAAFAAALQAGAAIQPVAIRHLRVDRRPAVGPRRNRICWYGDMRFLPHLAGLLVSGGTQSELVWLQQATGTTRKELARSSQNAIALAVRGDPQVV